MRFSVVTICLNQAAFISDAIESVLAQDHPDIEYLVVDAGSTDGSRDLIDGYRGRIDKVVFEPDEGPADGLNKALGLATGDIWACLNADDVLLPHAVSSASRHFLSEPSLDIVYGDGYIIDSANRILRTERSDEFSPRRYAYGVGVVLHQSTFIRRSVVVEAGGYNVLNRTCWDGELFLRLALAGVKMRHIPEYWGMFRIHQASITGSQRMRSECEADHRRLFEEVVGRPWRRSDALVVSAARVLKAARNPRRAADAYVRVRGSFHDLREAGGWG